MENHKHQNRNNNDKRRKEKKRKRGKGGSQSLNIIYQSTVYQQVSAKIDGIQNSCTIDIQKDGRR